MPRCRPSLCTLLIALTLAGLAPVHAEDAKPAAKRVAFIWFPRCSPDGKKLLTAHGSWLAEEGGEVRMWNLETGKELFVIPTDRGVRTVEWSPKGKVFAAGDYGGRLHLYDAESGKQTREMGLSGNVEVLIFTPDEKRIVTATGDGSVNVWELATGKPAYTWSKVHKGGIWGMALSPDGKTLATAGKDRFVRVFDLVDFKLRHELSHPGECNGVAFTPDNATLATGCNDAVIRAFEVASGKELAKLVGHEGGTVTDLQFFAKGKRLASAGVDRTVRLWDVSDIRQPQLKETLMEHSAVVFGVAISPDDKLLVSVGWDEKVRAWDLSKQKERWSWTRTSTPPPESK